MHQNSHSKGLNPKNEQFRPVFVGKIVQTKELCPKAKALGYQKAEAPDFRGFLVSGSILSSGIKLMGMFLLPCK
jgi:hypothetical protein